MATTVSNVNTALVDERVVPAMRYMRMALSMFSYAVKTGGGVIKNNIIRVPFAVDPDLATKTLGTFATGTGSLTGTDVTLDTLPAAGWDFKEGEVSRALYEQAVADKIVGGVYVVTKRIIDLALAYVTKANFGDTSDDRLVCVPADFTQSQLGALCDLADRKIKNQKQGIVLNSTYANSLLGQSVVGITQALAGNNVMSTGELPPLMGRTAMKYTALGTNSEALGGAIFGRAAICVGLAVPDALMDAGEGNIINRGVVKDDETDISLLWTEKGDAGGTRSGEVYCLAGFAKGQNAVVRLVSEA